MLSRRQTPAFLQPFPQHLQGGVPALCSGRCQTYLTCTAWVARSRHMLLYSTTPVPTEQKEWNDMEAPILCLLFSYRLQTSLCIEIRTTHLQISGIVLLPIKENSNPRRNVFFQPRDLNPKPTIIISIDFKESLHQVLTSYLGRTRGEKRKTKPRKTTSGGGKAIAPRLKKKAV